MNALHPLLPLALFALAPQEDRTPAPTPDEAPALEVVYLANEGFLLRRGETDVLIDAFVEEPFAGYAALTPEIAADLEATNAPFDSIELCLVSHAHGDHFQRRLAAAFLARSRDTFLASTPQVVDALLAAAPEGAELDERTEALLPDAGQRISLHRGDVTVELLLLPHGGLPNRKTQNLGHLITIDGMKVLHVGDADLLLDAFEPYALAKEEIDVAILPYWYFVYPAGRRLVAQHLPARLYVAAHVAPRDLGKVRGQLAEMMPHVVLFDAPLQGRSIGPREDR